MHEMTHTHARAPVHADAYVIFFTLDTWKPFARTGQIKIHEMTHMNVKLFVYNTRGKSLLRLIGKVRGNKTSCK